MSSKADYSAEEWKLILKAPLMAGLVIVAASPSGPLGVLREMFAVGKLVSETKTRAEGTGGLRLAGIVGDERERGAAGPLRRRQMERIESSDLQ